MLNKIFLQGRLVADPELRHTTSGMPVASFRLAVDRDFKDKATGERKADFINIVAWRQTAEFVSRFFTKGRMAIVEGSLQMRDYNDRDGNRRIAAEVVANNVYFGDSRRDNNEGGQPYGNSYGGGQSYGGNQGYNNQGYGNQGGYSAPPSENNYPSSGGNNYSAAPAVDQFADLTDDDGELPF